MKLLIEIWGNYHAWKKVTYLYNNQSIKSATTLPLLHNEIKPDKTIIIVADTLIENEIAQNTNYSSSNDFLKYDYLCQKVEKSTFEFIKSAIKNFCPESILESVSVLVTPAVGTFKSTQFKGNPNNFFSYLYFHLAKAAVTIAQTTNDDTIEIYVDITHGINYMTMITYRTIKDISAILAHFFNITFVVLNSDPFVGSENINLNINQIEKIKINPQLIIYKYDDTKPLKVSKNINDSIKADINKMLQADIKNTLPDFNNLLENAIYPFAGAACNSIPIFIVYFFPDIQSLYSSIDKTLKLFLKYLIVYTNNKLRIQQQVDFTSTFITILQTWLFAQLLATKYSITQNNQIQLPLIYSLIKVFNHNQTATSRIYREVSKINELDGKKLIPNDYADYGKILMGNDYTPDENVDNRNFFAHAGFGYTFIQVKKDPNTIYIKPKDELVEKVKKVLNDNIPQGLV